MALNQIGLGLLFTAKDAASGVMKNVRNGFAQTRDEFGKFGGRSKETFKQFGVGIATMGVGLAGLAILGSTADAAGEFGKAIALVRTEVDEATFSQADMKKVTLDLAKQFGRMPTDEAEALYKAVALGANTAAKATDVMTAVNQLAVAGNSDLKVTMDAIGGSLNAYGLQASDATSVSDAFFTAMKGGNTTVQDLASSVGRVSAGAHAMGISVQEVLGSVAVMTNKGIQASEAVSYLHGALANITHPSKDAAAEAARLGIKFDASAVRAQGFAKFLHSITDNAKFNAKSLEKLFTSVEGSQAMAMLAGDMKNVDAMMESMRNSAGATSAGFKIMEEKLTGARFDASFKALQIAIGEVVGPLLNQFKRFVTTLMNAFTALPVPIQRTIINIALVASTLTTLVGAVAAGIAGFKILSLAMTTFGGGVLGTVVSALAPAIAAIGLFYGAFKLLQKAYDENIGGFADWFDRIYSQAKLGIEAITQLFSQGGFSGAVRDEFLRGSNPVINFAIQVYLAFNRIKNFMAGLIDGFMDFSAEMQPTFDALRGAVDKLLDSFGLLSLDTREAGEAFDTAGERGKRTGVFLAKVVDVVLQGVTAFINLSAQIVPFIKWVSSLIDDLGGLETIVWGVKAALVAYGASMIASGVVSAVQFGASLIPVIVNLATLVSSLTISGAVAGFRAAMTAITTSAATALGPIGALTAAITALYLAYDQWQKLSKELEGSKDQFGKSHAWHDFSTKLRNDLGIDSDAETARRRGTLTGADFDANASFQARQRQLDAAGVTPLTAAPVANNTPSSLNSPALASVGSPAASFDQAQTNAAASAAAQAAASKVPIILNAEFSVDGEKMASVVSKHQSSTAVASYAPMSVAD